MTQEIEIKRVFGVHEDIDDRDPGPPKHFFEHHSDIGVALATELQHIWALEAGAAYYDVKTGDFHYGIPAKKQD